jgi:HK97 family phage portal protein
MRLTTAFGCIKIISEDLSRLPLEIFQSMPDSSMRLAKEHRCYSYLHDRPNSAMSSMVWRGAWLASALAYGNGYCWIKRDRAARVIGLYPLASDKTSPVRIHGKLAFATTQTDTGEAAYVDPGNILHLPGLMMDGITGLSPIQTCKNAFARAWPPRNSARSSLAMARGRRAC